MTRHTTILSTIVLVALVTVASLGAPAPSAVSATSFLEQGVPVAPAPVAAPPVPQVEESAPAASPDRLTAGQNPGVYYLDYGGTQMSPTTYPVEGAMRMFGWSTLQTGASSFNWGLLDGWITQRFGSGLSTGVFISTYDGKLDGDIRSTPDFVIQTPGAMIIMPETYTDFGGKTQSGYVDYYGRSYNGAFEYSSHSNAWDFAGNAVVTDLTPDAASRPNEKWAAKLGGTDNAADSITHWELRIPAMPPEFTTGTKMELRFQTYVDTTDVMTDTDHLIVELLASNGAVLATLQDITNSSGANGTWVTQVPINLNSWVGRTLKVRFRATTDGTSPTTFYVDGVKLNVRLIIPRYWSTGYQNAYSNFVTNLGTHLKNDSRVDFVAIGTGLHGEGQPCNEEEKAYLRDVVGLSSAQWVSAANAITDMYVSAFSTGITLRKNLLFQYAPSYLTAYERRDMTNYAAARGVGLSYNGLLPDWAGAITNAGWGSYDPMIAGGRYNYVPIAWETYTYMLCTPVYSYWSLFNGLDKHADYLRVGDDLLRDPATWLPTAHMPAFEWSKAYWGVTPQTAPSVWTVMREHRNPTPYCHLTSYPTYVDEASSFDTWPQLGNYNFWLFQEDGIAGGRTVAETNDPGADSRYAKNPVNGSGWPSAGLGNCPSNNSYASIYPANYPCFSTPYNPDLPPLVGSNSTNYYAPHSWTGEGKEAWVVRRTDQATGNPYMWFVIDSQYIDGSQTYLAEITVKYFDIGTDTWSLKYDSTTGEKVAGTVTKTGTKQLKERKFVISDGKFAKRLSGADFYVDSRAAGGANDGNEWVHMVDVKKLDSIDEPTQTPTATATATAT